MYGMAQVLVDDRSHTVDASLTLPNVTPDPGVGFCGQVLYDSGDLPLGQHTIEVDHFQPSLF